MGRHSVEDIFGSICILRDAHKVRCSPASRLTLMRLITVSFDPKRPSVRLDVYLNKGQSRRFLLCSETVRFGS